MKAFYTANANMCLNKPPAYKNTIKILQSLLGKNNVFSPENRGLVKVGDSDSEAAAEVKKKEKQLKESDIVIADITDGTAGVGYFISNALFLKKPTLVLQNKADSKNELHDSITTGKHKLLTYKSYDVDSLEETISNFLNKAKQKLDTKFILIISPEIDRYLEWASDFKRMHKAQIVRESIEKMMEKDKNWKKAQSM